MKIRKYQPKDKANVRKLIYKVLTEIFGRTVKIKLKDFEKDYAVFYVAEDNGKIVGSIGLKNEGKKICKLKRMYIYKEYRQKGLGDKLYRRVINFAKKKGFKEIRLTTAPRMKAAINFYKKVGFRIMRKPLIDRHLPELKNVKVRKIVFMNKKI